MSQLSLFSADLTPPRVEDLGGLLAAHGQTSSTREGARVSILLSQEWRATALLRELRVRDIDGECIPAAEALSAGLVDLADLPGSPSTATPSPAHGQRAGVGVASGAVLLRTRRSPQLTGLATAWTRGAVKSPPSGLVAGAGLLRCWALAAGTAQELGFFLGLDRSAPDTFEPLASACARAGLAGALIGTRGGGPGLRIVGHRRHDRLVELLGTPPPEAPSGAFPVSAH